MNDTSEKMQKLYHTLLMQKSGKDRLMMGFSMFDSSVKMMKASLPDDLSEAEMKVRIFSRLYKNDLEPKIFNKIVEHIEKMNTA